jgi:hypothetical protein
MREYGFDGDGRMVIEREHTAWKGLTKDTYWVYSPAGIEQWHFDKEWKGDAPVIHVAWFAQREGRIVSSHYAYLHAPAARTQYTWKHGRLVRARGRFDQRFEYDDIGTLLRIEQDGHVTFARSTPGRTLSDLAPVLRTELEAAIRSRLAKLRVREPIRAIALVLDEENYEHMLPPLLGAPTASERARLPAEWAGFDVPELAYETPRLRAMCDVANQDIWQHERYRAAKSLVGEVAAALDARPPSGRGWRAARGFRVYVTDLETGR